jgi:hypothetical protein
MTIYEENGFKNRREYLESLCDEYPRNAVFMLADLLGPSEDFDGLVTGLEDADFSDFEGDD